MLIETSVKNILITLPEPADISLSPFNDILKKYNVNIDFINFFSVDSVSTREFRDSKTYINDFSAVIFNSKHSVDHFFSIAKEVRVSVKDSMKYFCMSESISNYLQKYIVFRKRKIYFSEQSVSQLIDLIMKNEEETFLLPCSDEPNKEICQALSKAGVNYRSAVFYRTNHANIAKEVDLKKYDMLVFYNPKALESLKHNWKTYKQGKQIIATFGQSTKAKANEIGLKVSVSAPTSKYQSMTVAIDAYLDKLAKKNSK